MNKMPLSPRSLFPLLAAWMALGIIVLACGIGAPVPVEEAPAVAASPAPTQPSESQATPAAIPSAPPAIPERRRLILEFPPRIRAGDSDIARLTLEVDEQGNLTPTAVVEGNVVTGEVIEIPNVYQTHHVVAEARFDIAGVEVSPSELSSQAFTQGQTVTFYWSIRAREPGIYRGTIWFYLRFVDKISGEESRKTVSAQIVEIEAVNFLGLSANFARTTGLIGSIVGTVIGFPFFEDIVKFLFKRRGRRVRKI